MNNDIRVSTIQGFYKPEQPDRKLKIKSEANGYSDEIVVLIRENSTPEYDGEYDGYKLYGSESKRAEIYTITPEGTELSINTIPLSEEYTVVPIGLWIGVSSEITLTSEDYNSFAGHVDIFLEDLYEDKLIDFRKDNIYKFDANPGSLTDRFRLHFLPILNPTVTYDDKVTPDGFQNVVSTDEQAGLENSVKIYSHKNNIYINITGPFLNNSVEIYDVLGKEIFRKHSLESNFEKITIENSGYYIVKVLTGENYYTKKVFIN